MSNEVLLPSERVVTNEGPLFFQLQDGGLELKRGAFRALPMFRSVYQEPIEGDIASLYEKLYPFLKSFQKKGGFKIEALPLFPEGEITDDDLYELECLVATLYSLNYRTAEKFFNI